MDRYFKLAQARLEPDAEALRGLAEAQSLWATYADAECKAVARGFDGGSIQGVMTVGCRIVLTRERSHTIWANHLQYMDSTPPPVPEPLVSVAEERAQTSAN